MNNLNNIFNNNNLIGFPEGNQELPLSFDVPPNWGLMQCNANPRDLLEEHIASLVSNLEVVPCIPDLSEIAGNLNAKKLLKTLVVLPGRQPQLFEGLGTQRILLYGPPGVGKTKLVHGIAGEAKAKLFVVSCSDVASAFIGDSEKIIRGIFRFLRLQVGPQILFFDELDGIARKRQDLDQEFGRRLKTELMHQLTVNEDIANLTIICATNCPWDLDSAILRRFNHRIHMGLPNRAERNELLQVFLKNSIQKYDSNRIIEVLDRTEGFSGSDLYNLVQNALNIRIMELQDTKIWIVGDEGFFVPALSSSMPAKIYLYSVEDLPDGTVQARKPTFEDLLIALQDSERTVPQSLLERFQAFRFSK